MKPKLLFLIKVLFCSIGLFVIWHPVAQGYISLLKLLLVHITPSFPSWLLTYNGNTYFYKTSVYLIPFFSLMVATPKIRLIRKLTVTSTGVAIHLVINVVFVNFVFIRYLSHVGQATNIDMGAVYAMHQCFLLLLLHLLWIIANPAFIKLQTRQDTGHL